MNASEEAADFRQLDDQQLFAECRCVCQKLEHLPERSVDRARLGKLHAALTREFDRRARTAWTSAG